MTVAKTLQSATIKLSASHLTDIPHLEAEILLSKILKKPREFLLAHPEFKLTSSQSARFKLLIAKRLKGEPIAYIIGHKEFYGLDFKVNRNVLIPRPETEMMVEEVLRLIHSAKHLTLIDVGTGSGCVIITLAKLLNRESEIRKYGFLGIDISQKALAIAKQNARAHNLDKNIKFIKGNLLFPVIHDSSFIIPDSNLIILANLPYLDENWKNLLKSSNSAGLKYEPKIALDGGQDGLDIYRNLAEQIKSLAGVKITLLCEIGYLQAETMKKIFSFAENFQIKKDLSGLNRLVIIKINKKA